MLKQFSLLLLLTVQFPILSAQTAEDTLKKYSATRIAESIKIDGKLDDDAWKNAAVISDFVMNRPIEGGTPTQRTEVKIVYDNTAIYIGAMLYDTSPDSILHELALRDAIVFGSTSSSRTPPAVTIAPSIGPGPVTVKGSCFNASAVFSMSAALSSAPFLAIGRFIRLHR